MHSRSPAACPAIACYSAAPGSRNGFVASSSVPAVGETIITAVPRHTCRQCNGRVSAVSQLAPCLLKEDAHFLTELADSFAQGPKGTGATRCQRFKGAAAA